MGAQVVNVISRETIEEAHERIRPYIRRTPVLQSNDLDQELGCRAFLKCENLQEIGAFKARGAINTVLQIPENKLAGGIATHSSGNHAQAVALAAQIVSTQAFIVMPSNSLEIKKKKVLALGAKIFECEPTQSAREEMLEEIIKKTNAIEVHPFNDLRIIAGQATAARELVEEQSDLDFVLAPVGGGGLLSGTCLSIQHFSPSTKVIGCEPSGADDAFRSLQSGQIEVSQAQTIADGLRTSLGTKTYPVIRQLVDRIITVTDEEIVFAMKLVFDKMKLLIEPSSAVTIAALLKEKEVFANKRVGIIVTGGNIDPSHAQKLFETYRLG